MISKQIAEINQHIRDGVEEWADIMLMADADQWAVNLMYYPRDIVNATMIFQHICTNVGIKSGHITADNAAEIGKRLSELVKDMTGWDVSEIVKSMKHG